MPTVQEAFEIVYDSSLEVVEHSELFFHHLPGTAEAASFLEKHQFKLTPAQLGQARDQGRSLPQLQELVRKMSGQLAVRVRGEQIRVTWQRTDEGLGSYSIRLADQIAIVGVIDPQVMDPQNAEPPKTFPSYLQAEMKLMMEFHEVSPDTAVDQRMLKLMTLTRRPLMGSIYWVPFTLDELTPTRLIQWQLAYAALNAHDEMS